MGGTTGALYSIFFSVLAQGFTAAAGGKPGLAMPEIWAAALDAALARLYTYTRTYTRACPPSRTLVDPLAAFVETFKAKPADAGGAAAAAARAAEGTRDVEAKAGRSAYVEGDRLKNERVPDPGAWGVKVLLEALVGN